MLDATLTTEFIPGTNLKGGAAGANWSYVLPTLEWTRVLCVGTPSLAALATLQRNAQQVVVVCRSRRDCETVQRRCDQAGLSDARILHAGREAMEHVPAQSCDVIYLANRGEVVRAALSARTRNRYERWLKPNGQLYYELSGIDSRLLTPCIAKRWKAGPRRVQSWWVTPVLGETQTFVPLVDRQTMRFFAERRLTGVSARAAQVKASVARQSVSHDAVAPRTKPRSSSQASAGQQPRRPFSPALKAIGRRVIGAAQFLERRIAGPGICGQWLGRRGMLLGPIGTEASDAPPRYLCELAQSAGVSLEKSRWGLAATGDYDSRKLVFFLFQSAQNVPSAVVKMTRSSLYNTRLQQEERALRRLEEIGVGDRETLPRVLFAGTHGGLAIVGETAVNGVPFDRRTTGMASCPYARAALAWLTELGSRTAAPLAARPGEVASGLEQLLSRFADIYQISSNEHAFLRAQIEVLNFNPLPLVFQHGDPGRWNVMVTPHGRISFLDWEAAEPNGMPLWDLLYFLRSFAMCVAEKQRAGERLESLDRLLLQESPVAELAIESVQNYCADTGLSGRLVEPLFYTCWMHRALKESTRLPEPKLREGHYYNFLKLCIERRESPTLSRLFALT